MLVKRPSFSLGPGNAAAWMPTIGIFLSCASWIGSCRLAASAEVMMPLTLSAIAWLKALIQPTGVALPSMIVTCQPILGPISLIATPQAREASLFSSLEM